MGTDSSSIAKRTRNRINCNGRSLHPVGTWVEHKKGLVDEKKNSVMIPECVESVPMEVHSKFGLGTAATDIGAKEKKVPRNITALLDGMHVIATAADALYAASQGGTTAESSGATRFFREIPVSQTPPSEVTLSRTVFRRLFGKDPGLTRSYAVRACHDFALLSECARHLFCL